MNIRSYNIILFIWGIFLMSITVGKAQINLSLGGNIAAGYSLIGSDLSDIKGQGGLATKIRFEAGIPISQSFNLVTGIGYGRYTGTLMSSDLSLSESSISNTGFFFLDEFGQKQYVTLDRTDLINLNEKVLRNVFQIPILIEIFSGPFYLQAGPIVNLGLGPLNLSGSGSVDYHVFIPVAGSNVYDAGLGIEEVSVSNSNLQLNQKPVTFDAAIGIGFEKVMNSKQKFRVGLNYQLGTNFISPIQDQYQNELGQSAYPSLAALSESLGFGTPSISFGYYMKMKSTDENPIKEDCPPNQQIALSVNYVQSDQSRRDPEKPDPEFQQILASEKKHISFGNGNWNVEQNEFTFCQSVNPDPALLPHFPAQNEYLEFLDAQSDYRENLDLEFYIKNPVYDFAIIVKDQFGSIIEDSEIRVIFRQQLLYQGSPSEVKFQSILYRHPNIQYELQIFAPCFEEKILILDEKMLSNGRLIVNLQGGGGTKVSLDLISDYDISSLDINTISGVFEGNRDRHSVTGKILGDQLTFEIPCGTEINSSSKLKFQKPRGIDLYGYNSPGGESFLEFDASYAIKNEGQPIYLKPLAQFHFFFLNIPFYTERSLAMDTLVPFFESIFENEHLVYLQFGHSSAPQSIYRSVDIEAFSSDYIGVLPEGQTTFDGFRIRQELNNRVINFQRREVYFHFYLEASQYQEDWYKIQDFLQSFNNDLIGAKIFMFTDVPISRELRVNGAEIHYHTW